MENFRRAIGLRLKEVKEVFEGEITQLQAEESENPLGGYGKVSIICRFLFGQMLIQQLLGTCRLFPVC